MARSISFKPSSLFSLSAFLMFALFLVLIVITAGGETDILDSPADPDSHIVDSHGEGGDSYPGDSQDGKELHNNEDSLTYDKGNSPMNDDHGDQEHQEHVISPSVKNLLEESFDRLVALSSSPSLDGESMSDGMEHETSNSSDTEQTTTSNNDTLSGVPSHRWPCKSFNVSANATTVVINNETEYTEILARMNTTHGCGLLLFYSPHCEFCTQLAPLYNALGRAYPDLAVMAVNVEEAMRMAAGYGVVGIPTVFFFYSGRPVSKFNRTRDAASFQSFIQELAGYAPLADNDHDNSSSPLMLKISDVDMDGPIRAQVIESRDYYLIFSCVFLASYLVLRLFGGKLLNSIAQLLTLCFNLYKRLVGYWSRVVKGAPPVVENSDIGGKEKVD